MKNIFKENKMRKELFEEVVRMFEDPSYEKRTDLVNMVIIQIGGNRDFETNTFEVKKKFYEDVILIEHLGWGYKLDPNGHSYIDSTIVATVEINKVWHRKMYDKLYEIIH